MNGKKERMKWTTQDELQLKLSKTMQRSMNKIPIYTIYETSMFQSS